MREVAVPPCPIHFPQSQTRVSDSPMNSYPQPTPTSGGGNKPFTFDDPDDEYWNASIPPQSSSLHDQSAPLDNLFEFCPPCPSNSVATSTPLRPMTANATPQPSQNHEESPVRRLDTFSDLQSVASDDVSASTSASDAPHRAGKGEVSCGKEHVAAGKRGGSVSILSECSLNSISTELTVHLDYARLKHEHRKLQRHFEVGGVCSNNVYGMIRSNFRVPETRDTSP